MPAILEIPLPSHPHPIPSSHTSLNTHPREVIFVDSLPTTHLGKVDRGELSTRSLRRRP
jgi:acyl-coenzyme A synthetase/AMP-(fatty) acid ligase